jgi:hypothetical protein
VESLLSYATETGSKILFTFETLTAAGQFEMGFLLGHDKTEDDSEVQ